MKKLLLSLPFLLTACGNPSLSGVPIPAVVPDPEYSVFESVRIFTDAAGVTMTAAPIGGNELTNNVSRLYVDLTDFQTVRGQFVSSLTSAVINCRIEYSLDDGGIWATLVPNFAASTSANITAKSAYIEIPSEARTDVLIRALIVGNGALNPIIRYVGIDLKGQNGPVPQD